MSGAAGKKIRIERNNHIGFADFVHGVNVASERQLGAFRRSIAAGRLPLVPLCLRIHRKQLLHLRVQRGGSHRAGQNAESRAIGGFRIGRKTLRGIEKRGPGINFAGMLHRLRAVWIVQIQDRSLHQRAGGTHAGGMIGIAFEFRGPPFMAFHQNANRRGAKRHGSGIKIRPAQNEAIGLFHIRNDVIDVWTSAARKSRQRQRRAH